MGGKLLGVNSSTEARMTDAIAGHVQDPAGAETGGGTEGWSGGHWLRSGPPLDIPESPDFASLHTGSMTPPGWGPPGGARGSAAPTPATPTSMRRQAVISVEKDDISPKGKWVTRALWGTIASDVGLDLQANSCWIHQSVAGQDCSCTLISHIFHGSVCWIESSASTLRRGHLHGDRLNVLNKCPNPD